MAFNGKSLPGSLFILFISHFFPLITILFYPGFHEVNFASNKKIIR